MPDTLRRFVQEWSFVYDLACIPLRFHFLDDDNMDHVSYVLFCDCDGVIRKALTKIIAFSRKSAVSKSSEGAEGYRGR